jgi:hypothetical protein
MRKRRPYGMSIRGEVRKPRADLTPSICAGCFEPVDYLAVARAIDRREPYAHACGRTLVDPAYLPPVGGP